MRFERWLTVLRHRLRSILGRRRQDEELDRELGFHLDQQIAENLDSGMNADDARRAAIRAMGGIAPWKDASRDAWGVRFVESLVQDIAYAVRGFRRSPTFAAAAVLTLALGVGSTTAIFHLFDTVVVETLPVPEPENLVVVQPLTNGEPFSFNYPVFRELSDRQEAVEGMFAATDAPVQRARIAGGEPFGDVHARLVTGGYFSVLRVDAQIGRVLTADDDRTRSPVAVISDGLWQRVWGGQSDALGRAVEIGDAVVTIVGVAPRGFFGEALGRAPDLWLPLGLASQVGMPGLDLPAQAWIVPMARLRADVPLEAAAERLRRLYDDLSDLDLQIQTTGNNARGLVLEPGAQGVGTLRSEFSEPLRVLMGIAVLVVLVACCNLANLLLARGTARRQEVGMRLTLGAGRGRLVRQLLTESLVLAGLGGASGLGIALWGADMLTALASAGQDWQLSVGIGPRVLLFATTLTGATAAIFGLVPALVATRRPRLAPTLSTSRHLEGTRSRQSAAKSFVVAQLALSFVLVAGAAILGKSYVNLMSQDFGYRREGVLIVRFPFDLASIRRTRSPVFYADLAARLRAIPGVESVALAGAGPLGNFSTGRSLVPEGRPVSPTAEVRVRTSTVSAGYFETMGIPILAGRGIADDDLTGAPRVAVITESAARTLFEDPRPLGRFLWDGIEFDPETAIEVVGIVPDVRFSGPRDELVPVVFEPFAQRPGLLGVVAIDVAGNPIGFIGPVRAALDDVAPDLAGIETLPISTLLAAGIHRERLVALLAAAFGMLALVLAAVGLYGVVAYTVQLRTPEIGLRMALGARRRDVRRLLLGQVLFLLVAGLIAGGTVAVAAGPAVRSLLFGLTPTDPGMLGAAAIVLIAVGLTAAYLPVRRAIGIDPLEALRRDH